MAEPSFAQGLIGVTLDGRYRLDAVLGEGGMGSVFRATQLAMERKVAVKLLKPHLTTDRAALERFSREARATLKVESPHAVKILDFGVTPLGDYYMVLEYLDGRTVQRELEIDGPFAPARVAHIARQALHALGVAHAQGLIHRDVKPDNLLLMRVGTDADYTKILDFGVAKLMQGTAGDPASLALTADGMVFGTPEFMSPEQACGQSLDGRSDLYSLAATMFVMLTGTMLFEGRSAIEWLTHHARTPPPQLAMVRPDLAAYPELDDLLQCCLAKQPDKRPANAQDMARRLAELEPALQRGPAPARTPSKPTVVHASSYFQVLRNPGSTVVPASPMAVASPAEPSVGSGETTGVRAVNGRRSRSYLWLAGIAVASLIGGAAGVALHRSSDRSTESEPLAAAPTAMPIATAPTATPIATAPTATPIGTAPASGLAVVATDGEASAPRSGSASGGSASGGSASGGSASGGSASGGSVPGTGAGTDNAGAAPTGAGAPTVGGGSANAGAATPGDTARAPDPRSAGASGTPTAGPPGRRPVRQGTPAVVRPARREPPKNPEAEAHLRAAEEAFQNNLPLMRQLEEAHAALLADPSSSRAKFLLADALLKYGDVDHGCKYLAEIKRVDVARARARAAGCPGN